MPSKNQVKSLRVSRRHNLNYNELYYLNRARRVWCVSDALPSRKSWMGESADCARHLIAKHSHNLLSNKVREINVSRQVSISCRSAFFKIFRFTFKAFRALLYVFHFGRITINKRQKHVSVGKFIALRWKQKAATKNSWNHSLLTRDTENYVSLINFALIGHSMHIIETYFVTINHHQLIAVHTKFSSFRPPVLPKS